MEQPRVGGKSVKHCVWYKYSSGKKGVQKEQLRNGDVRHTGKRRM